MNFWVPALILFYLTSLKLLIRVFSRHFQTLWLEHYYRNLENSKFQSSLTMDSFVIFSWTWFLNLIEFNWNTLFSYCLDSNPTQLIVEDLHLHPIHTNVFISNPGSQPPVNSAINFVYLKIQQEPTNPNHIN